MAEISRFFADHHLRSEAASHAVAKDWRIASARRAESIQSQGSPDAHCRGVIG